MAQKATDKQLELIADIEKCDYVPPFKGWSKEEASEYIAKYKEFLNGSED